MDMRGLSHAVTTAPEQSSRYQRYDISKDAYPFLDADVPTIAAFAVMVGNTDTIDEELGYQLAKAMVENANEITHAQGAQMKIGRASCRERGERPHVAEDAQNNLTTTPHYDDW